MSKMTADEMNTLFESAFTGRPKPWPKIIEAKEDYIKIELVIGKANLRPGALSTAQLKWL